LGQQALQVLAGRSWRHLPAAYDDAVRLSALPLEDLLGVLVHPPEPPAGTDLTWPDWLRSVQAWACLGIAHHHSDEPWPDSTRRSVLIDLAYGCEDWTTEAALLGLIATAWVHPDTRAEINDLVGWRFMAAILASQPRPQRATVVATAAVCSEGTVVKIVCVGRLSAAVMTVAVARRGGSRGRNCGRG
jgi:hypothetical protein